MCFVESRHLIFLHQSAYYRSLTTFRVCPSVYKTDNAAYLVCGSPLRLEEIVTVCGWWYVIFTTKLPLRVRDC